MGDRFIVSLVDETNHVRAQTPNPGILRSQVPDAVALAITGWGAQLEELPAGWVVTICKVETGLNLHLTAEERAAFEAAHRRKAS